ncbi:MAG: polyphosphate kinase 2 family protein [Betaproteobacteria bacterium]|nr:MAG: polyphosphate kinase 2 family protein [Betaproteobacteria bacterium]
MKIDIKDYRVPSGNKVKLDKWPTLVEPIYSSKQEYKALLDVQVAALSEQQEIQYASNRYAVLVILQAMDAAGKDSAIKHVMSGVNPQGCQVYSFKHPSASELDHDFLWRTTRELPERGRIGIFNRSYYEEVLVVRVHPEIMEAEHVPDGIMTDDEFWQERYYSINGLERHLHHNGTRIIKLFLHLSKEEQRKRLLARIDKPEKNWKIQLQDVEERKYWDDYMRAYEACLSSTSTRYAPWYIVPADDKANSRLIISQIILETFKSLKLTFPTPSEEHRKELQLIRKQLLE